MNQRNKRIYELKNLKKDYSRRTVLNIGRLQIHPGTIYGIIGPVGSGKSTLLRILAAKEKQTSGSIEFDNSTFKTNWFGRIVGNENIYLADPESIPPGQKVSQVVTTLHPGGADKLRKRYFDRGNKKTIWDQPVKNISPGECAWLSMILALESDPRVLLIDDYGTILDPTMEKDFRKKLIRMNRDLGTTIILAAPDDSQVRRFASVLIFLDNGHISKIRPGFSKSKGNRT